MGVMRGRSGNAVILSGSGPREKISYCEECLKVKILSPLKHRIYLDEDGKITKPPGDSKNWLQCWTCGLIVKVKEAKPEVELDTLTKPKKGGILVETAESRKVDRTGRTQRIRKLKRDVEQYKEEDIKHALRKGQKLVSYVET
jgi:hypothetical protein